MLRRYISRRVCGPGEWGCWFISLIRVIMLWTEVDKISIPLMLDRSVADSSRWRCSSARASSVKNCLMANNFKWHTYLINHVKRNFVDRIKRKSLFWKLNEWIEIDFEDKKYDGEFPVDVTNRHLPCRDLYRIRRWTLEVENLLVLAGVWKYLSWTFLNWKTK